VRWRGGEIMCEVSKEHLARGLTGGGARTQCSEVDPYISHAGVLV